MKIGRLGIGIGSRNTTNIIDSPDSGRWVKFFPYLYWQTCKPYKKAVVKLIWEKDATRFFPECIVAKGVITKSDLSWKGTKCKWERINVDEWQPSTVSKYNLSNASQCKTCGEVKEDGPDGKILQKGAIRWKNDSDVS